MTDRSEKPTMSQKRTDTDSSFRATDVASTPPEGSDAAGSAPTDCFILRKPSRMWAGMRFRSTASARPRSADSRLSIKKSIRMAVCAAHG